MPQETLAFPPVYCLVGAYRLAHDPALWKPMWKECSKAFKQAGLVASGWAVVSWPMQKLFVYYFMRGSAKVSGMSAIYHTFTSHADKLDGSHDSRLLGWALPSLTTFAAMIFVLGQCHQMIEFWLRRKLRVCRNRAYEATIQSRGKPVDWWTPYWEEWEDPPLEKAKSGSQKQKLYVRLASPFIRMFVMRILLLPLNFIPFFGMIVSSFLRSLSLGRQLHSLFFAHKRMTPMQIELWVTERRFEYRSFGLAAAFLESFPLIGMFFSISNRVGAAMYAHDLEKRQQKFRNGEIRKLPRSETHSLVPKIPFVAHGDGVNVPGGLFSSGGQTNAKANQAQEDDEPPAYTVSEATEMVGGDGEGGPPPPSSVRRRVPPPPSQ